MARSLFTAAEMQAWRQRDWGAPGRLQAAEWRHMVEAGDTSGLLRQVQVLAQAMRLLDEGWDDAQREAEDYEAHLLQRARLDAHEAWQRRGAAGGAGAGLPGVEGALVPLRSPGRRRARSSTSMSRRR